MQILINRPGQGWRACGADQLRELLPRSVAHTLRTGAYLLTLSPYQAQVLRRPCILTSV